MILIVSHAGSNDEEGTWSEPRIFTEPELAKAYYMELFNSATNGFIQEGYCSADDVATMMRVYNLGKDTPDMVGTSGSLGYSFINGNFDFWNNSGYDFGYTIELHIMKEDDALETTLSN